MDQPICTHAYSMGHNVVQILFVLGDKMQAQDHHFWAQWVRNI